MVANKPSLNEIFANEKPSLEDIFTAPADVMGGVAQRNLQNAQENTSIDAAARSFGQAAMFGLADEANAYLTSKGLDPFNKQMPYEQKLAMNRAADEHSALDNPVASMAGTIGGSLVPVAGVAAAAPRTVAGLTQFASKGLPNALAVSSGTGALSGSLYGFGSGEGGLQGRVQAATEGGVLGGLTGVVTAAAARPVASLVERAMRLVSRKGTPAAQAAAKSAPVSDAISRSPKPVTQAATAPDIVQGGVVPLTRGQATQDPAKQSLENMARAGALGDDAQASMVQADYRQQDAIRNAVSGIVGTPDEQGLVEGAGLLRKEFKDIKAQVGQAYDNAAVIRNVFVDKKPISEAFLPRINDIMKNQGFDASNITGESKNLFDELEMLKEPKITALNLEKMEFWRRKAANRAEQLRGDPEGVMMKRVVSAYDDFMGKLPAEALKGGDETALNAINEARNLRRRQGVLFERNKVVERVVKDDELTNEQLANLVLTGNASQQNIGAGTGGAIKAMKLAAGGNAEQLMDGLRKGAMARVLNKAQTTMLRGNSEVQMLSPAKLAKELDNLLNNRTFMREVFDEQSRNTLFALRNDVRKIASEQTGARNYSNTAYTVLRALKGLPLGLSSVGGIAEIGLKPVAERSAQRALQENLAPVLQEVQSALVGNSRVYGATAGGAIGGTEQQFNERAE